MEEKNVVAYLDLLGFSSHLYSNIDEALRLLNDYNFILKQGIVDGKSYPNLVNAVNSFKYFLPFSDSIFILSSDPDVFVKQISSFLLGCFNLQSYYYANPENLCNPEDVSVHEYSSGENGRVVMEEKLQKWHPLLFRGGISYGESHIFDVNAIYNSELKSIKNITGRAIVKAVKELEPLGKGPRLFCDSNFYNKLKHETKKYCESIGGCNFEILWPAYRFEEKNDLQIEINNYEMFLIKPVENLWKAYKNQPIGAHYKEFLKLVFRSCIRFSEIRDDKCIACNTIRKYIDPEEADMLFFWFQWCQGC